MKKVLLVLVSVLFVFTGCCGIQHKPTEDVSLSVHINTPFSTEGNGVIIHLPGSEQGELYILTAAHLFSFEELFEMLYSMTEQITDESMKKEFIRQTIIAMDATAKTNDGLRPTLVNLNITGAKVLQAKPYAIDFDNDLALVRATDYFSDKTIRLGKVPEPGTEIVTVFVAPTMSTPIMLYGRIGLNILVQMPDKKERTYVQTQLNIGHGASGAPVFDKEGNLIGLIGAEFVIGEQEPKTHGTMLIPSTYISEFIAMAQLGHFCTGDSDRCAVITGERTLAEQYVRFLNSKGINVDK